MEGKRREGGKGRPALAAVGEPGSGRKSPRAKQTGARAAEAEKYWLLERFGQARGDPEDSRAGSGRGWTGREGLMGKPLA